MTSKEFSPFTPGSPVPVELFVGRSKQLHEAIRYIRQTASGKQENVFLTGDRGIGKSSLASFIRHFVVNQENFLGLHVFLGRVTTLEDMVRLIFDQLLKETQSQPWFNQIAQSFGKYIKQLGLFGISVAFAPPKEDLQKLVWNFPEVIHNILKQVTKEKRGLFIALDDINGLAEKEEFANWYKSFADQVATHYPDFPVYMMLIGLPGKRDALSKLQPSLMRVFRVIEIEKLTNDEVESFFDTAFEKAEIKIERKAMDLMIQFSSGLPVLMHEIGDATFWENTDNIVDEKDALQGIVVAAENVGRKYLDPKVYRAIRSDAYRSILKKLAKTPLSRYFTKKDIEDRLDDNEKKVFHNFLRKFRELGIIESDVEKGRGSYQFVNEIYPVYIWMESGNLKKVK